MTSLKENLILIGNGMVSCHFCIEFVSKGLGEKYNLIVFGEEPKPAYDRVSLTKYADNRDPKEIELKPPSWYKENAIILKTGTRISTIHKESKSVMTASGEKFDYDKLILATGSSPFVPPLTGSDLEGVFTYRTYQDVDNMIEYCKNSRVAVVAGGGLLGLEAADFLRRIGMKTYIVELADYLLPRQLDWEGAEVFKTRINKQGFEIYNSTKIEKIEKNKSGSLKVYLSNGVSIDADVTVISNGIRSNSDIAKDAGIECSPAKGVVIDDTLTTSDDNIFAIGECARYEGRLYGLAAPGYKMAEILVDRLQGKDSLFKGADMSTRLKMLGEDVISLGDALQPEKTYTYHKDSTYRKLVYSESDGLVGALGVGEWPEAGQIQGAMSAGMPLNDKEIKKFLKSGNLWKEQADITKWPDNTVICNCMNVTKGAMIDCIKSGCSSPSQIAAKTGASTICGSCDPLLQQLCGNDSVERHNKPEKILLTVSIATLAAALAIIFTPVLWGGNSIDSDKHRFTQQFTSFLYRQITGFSLLFLTVCAGSISLRKRWSKFSFGSFRVWRLLHGFIGLASLIVLIFHTGLSAGKNINMILFTAFTVINILGFLTGVAASFEFFGLNKLSAFCRRWRRQITFLHILAFWPLPLLITFHIIQAYYF